MNCAIITAITEKGKSALKKAYEEGESMRRSHRIKFKMLGFVQSITNQEPYTLKIEIKNRYFQQALQTEQFSFQIKDTLKQNGAEESDYKIEVQ